jgi:hypothetical protein
MKSSNLRSLKIVSKILSCCTYFDTVLRDRRLLDLILLYLFWHYFERSEIAWSHLTVLILTLFSEIGDCLISSCCTYFDTILRDRRMLDFILLYLFWHCFERSEIAWSYLVVLILTLFWEIGECLISSCCTYFDTVLRDRRLLDFILLYLFWHCFERSEIAWSHLVVLILTLFWEIGDCLISSISQNSVKISTTR